MRTSDRLTVPKPLLLALVYHFFELLDILFLLFFFYQFLIFLNLHLFDFLESPHSEEAVETQPDDRADVDHEQAAERADVQETKHKLNFRLDHVIGEEEKLEQNHVQAKISKSFEPNFNSGQRRFVCKSEHCVK